MSLGICTIGFTGAARIEDRNLDQVCGGVMGGQGGHAKCCLWGVNAKSWAKVTFNGQSLPLGADKLANHKLFLTTLLQ